MCSFFVCFLNICCMTAPHTPAFFLYLLSDTFLYTVSLYICLSLFSFLFVGLHSCCETAGSAVEFVVLCLLTLLFIYLFCCCF